MFVQAEKLLLRLWKLSELVKTAAILSIGLKEGAFLILLKTTLLEYVIVVSRALFVFVNDIRTVGGIIVQVPMFVPEHVEDVSYSTEGTVKTKVPVGAKPGKM